MITPSPTLAAGATTAPAATNVPLPISACAEIVARGCSTVRRRRPAARPPAVQREACEQSNHPLPRPAVTVHVAWRIPATGQRGPDRGANRTGLNRHVDRVHIALPAVLAVADIYDRQPKARRLDDAAARISNH